MKTMKDLARLVFMNILTAAVTISFTACSSDEDLASTDNWSVQKCATRQQVQPERTVLVYMAGRNNLTNNENHVDFLKADLKEIKEGSKKLSDKDCMLVFVCRYLDDSSTETPWLARIWRGEVTDSVSVTDMGISKSDARACDPVVMEQVMRYACDKYAATRDYGLVLWGHGTGWVMGQEVSSTRAYGLDNGNCIGNSGKWINVPTLKNILQKMPHMKFIMCDCCHMMCLEDLYELRHVTDYMIGSPAEILGQGAPYDTILPAMFEKEMFYSSIIERYHTSVKGELPLSVVKMSEMDNVAQATAQALQSVKTNLGDGYADMTGIIHYGYDDNGSEHLDVHNFYYDAGDFMSRYASAADYQMWNEALSKAVIMKRTGYKWDTLKKWEKFYTDFKMTEEKFHGVSMFVPQSPSTGNYNQYNDDIKQMEWFKLLANDY